MKKSLIAVICFGFLFFISSMSHAEQGEYGLALKAGTLGVGAEATIGIVENINARIGLNYLSLDYDGSESNVDYAVELDLMTISLLFDWHPAGNGFRLTAGALYNGNEVEAIGEPTNGNFTIDDTPYNTTQVGTLKAEIDFNSFAPYVGIGYGNAVGKTQKWSFVFDLGVMYQGSPDVSFTATGTSAGNATFLSELENERRQLESEIEDFQFYPVISFGISYKF